MRQAAKNDRAARLESRRTVKGGSIYQIEKKILLFEINFRDEKDEFINKIDKLIMTQTNHYLNIYGLFIFLRIAKHRFYIRRGIYNIIKIREHIYNKLILIDEYKTTALFTILDIYNTTLKVFNIPEKPFVYQELNILALTSNPEIEEFINSTEAIINEILRPYINNAIYSINNEIKTLEFTDNYGNKKNGSEYTGIFVVGGDAIRRYNTSDTITKDIDSKIYMPGELDINTNIANFNIINKCIYSNLFNLLSFLISNSKIFDSFPETEKVKIFSSTEYNNYSCKVSINLKSSDNPDHLNFRYRQLPNNLYPVDLYSLDYEFVIIFEYTLPSGETKIYKHNHNIAFIDISLETSQDNNYDKYAVLSNKLPIGNLDFLIQDLIKTYNSDSSSLLRFINGKNIKDYERYKKLIEFAKNPSKFTIASDTKIITYNKPTMRENNAILDKIGEYTFEDFNMRTKYNKYLALFTKLYTHNINQRVKQKIIYDYNESILLKQLKTITGGKNSNKQLPIINKMDELININLPPTDNDKYIFNIMKPINELSPEENRILFQNLIKKKGGKINIVS